MQPLRIRENHCVCRFCEGKAPGREAVIAHCAPSENSALVFTSQAHRNLSQLPNFAFSVPLAYFLLSQQADLPEQELSSAREKASLLVRQALIMFPGGGCYQACPVAVKLSLRVVGVLGCLLMLVV